MLLFGLLHRTLFGFLLRYGFRLFPQFLRRLVLRLLERDVVLFLFGCFRHLRFGYDLFLLFHDGSRLLFRFRFRLNLGYRLLNGCGLLDDLRFLGRQGHYELRDGGYDAVKAVAGDEAVVASAVFDERGVQVGCTGTDYAVMRLRELLVTARLGGELPAYLLVQTRGPADIEIHEALRLGGLHVDQGEERIVDALVQAYIGDDVLREDFIVDSLTFCLHGGIVQLSLCMSQKDLVVDEPHRGLHVLRHETVQVAGAFADGGVLDIGRCEVRYLAEDRRVEEHHEAVGCERGEFIGAERGPVQSHVPEQAGDVEPDGFLQQLGPVHLDVGCLLADVLLQLLGRDPRHVLQVPWKITIHRTLRYIVLVTQHKYLTINPINVASPSVFFAGIATYFPGALFLHQLPGDR